MITNTFCQCFGSVSFWYGSGSCTISDLQSGKYQLLFLQNMIYFVSYGVNIYVSKHKFNRFEKMYEILMILVDFCGNFHDFGWIFATRIRFIEADPDPVDQNETDPNGSGSATLLYYVRLCVVHITVSLIFNDLDSLDKIKKK